MGTSVISVDEDYRLDVLSRYAILDTMAEEGFDRITKLASQLLQTPIALVSLIDKNRQWFKSCFGFSGTETSREVSFCAHAIYRTEPLIIHDATKDPRFAENPYVMADPHVRFYAGIPLVVSEGVALGTLCVIDMKPRLVKPSELDVLKNLAAVICDELALNKLIKESERDRNELAKREAELAALNASLEEKVEHRTQALKEAQHDILVRLGRAAAFRDNDTNQHVQRMSLFCEHIAREFGMPEAYCKLIRITSPLHDIGKIGVPDAILHKPGSLTSEEMNKMREHVVVGQELLSGGHTELIQLAELIAHTHHERWDGTGYPRGLTETSIPLAGRIAAIADVFDALTSERPYKKAWPIEKAVEEIQSQAGKQFDPDLVAAFVRALPKIRTICIDYSNPIEDYDVAA